MARASRKKRKQTKTKRTRPPQSTVEAREPLVTTGTKHSQRQKHAEHHSREKDEQHPKPCDRKGTFYFMTGFFSQLSLSVFFVVSLGFFFVYWQQGRQSQAIWWGFASYLFVGLAIACNFQHNLWSKAETEVQTTPVAQQPAAVIPSPEPPKTPHDYFKADFSDTLRITRDFGMNVEGKSEYQFESQLILDFESKTKYLTIYLPPSVYTPLAYRFIPEVYKELLQVDYSGIAAMEARWPGERGTDLKDLQFSRRVIIYHEGELLSSDADSLTKLYKAKGLDVRFRGLEYVTGRNNSPLATSR